MTDEEATQATPTPATQPLSVPPPPEPPVHDSSAMTAVPPGWKSSHVAVVAALALSLGAALGALLWSTGDDQRAAQMSTTASTTSPPVSTTAGASTSTTASSTPTTSERSRSGGATSESGGQTVIGNSIYTGTFQSNTDKSTDDFTVGDDWQIRWDVAGGTVSVDIHQGDEVTERLDLEGRGERRFAEGGTYRLEITTDGSRYTVVVTDGP